MKPTPQRPHTRHPVSLAVQVPAQTADPRHCLTPRPRCGVSGTQRCYRKPLKGDSGQGQVARIDHSLEKQAFWGMAAAYYLDPPE